ncbi:MAG: hypothetical protein Q9183_003706, partial [Haloplaca sp. 2 TL-2023]
DPLVVPGGAIPPASPSLVLLLDAAIRPRMSFYLEGEDVGSMIVDARLGRVTGVPFEEGDAAAEERTELRARDNATSVADDTTMKMRIYYTSTHVDLLPASTIKAGDEGVEKSFPLPRPVNPGGLQVPLPVTLELTKTDGTVFRADTKLYYLPNPTISQSAARIDSLYGGIQVSGGDTYASWETIFPYSFYLSGAWLQEDPGNLKRFSDLGYNILHVVPGGQGIGYDLDQLDGWFTEAENLGLWIMFDMRWTYQNEDYVRTQIERYKSRKNMLLWYTADEPDGHEDAPSATSKSYAFIKSLDPYHPISLCLNCQNYYFESYASGADIILADAYPIGNNLTYSTKYKYVRNPLLFHSSPFSSSLPLYDMLNNNLNSTPCNSTYGDCGCDNCVPDAMRSPLFNIPERLDFWHEKLPRLPSFRNQQPKTFWSVPQSFPRQDFWTRTPTGDEVIAMALLAINHGAKGIIGWDFPTDEAIIATTSRFAKDVVQQTDDAVPLQRLVSPRGGLAHGVSAGSFEWFGKYILAGADERVWGEAQEVEFSLFDLKGWRIGKRVLVSIVCLAEEGVQEDLRFGVGEGDERLRIFRGVVLWDERREGWDINIGEGVLTKRGGMMKAESAVIEVGPKEW